MYLWGICIYFGGYEILENLERQRLKLTPEWTPSIIRSNSSGLLKKSYREIYGIIIKWVDSDQIPRLLEFSEKLKTFMVILLSNKK